MCDLLWSDPDERGGWGISPRGAGYTFGQVRGAAGAARAGPALQRHCRRCRWMPAPQVLLLQQRTQSPAPRPGSGPQRRAGAAAGQLSRPPAPPTPPLPACPPAAAAAPRAGHQRAVQPHQRAGPHLARAPAGDGGLQLVARAERGHHLLGAQLLLQVRPARAALASLVVQRAQRGAAGRSGARYSSVPRRRAPPGAAAHLAAAHARSSGPHAVPGPRLRPPLLCSPAPQPTQPLEPPTPTPSPLPSPPPSALPAGAATWRPSWR